MAELTAGAVNALLGVLRNELLLLSQLGGDVQFIKEEMESMNSFLAHLARTTPPAGTHDEQVRAWMKQVRDLAQDCSSCIDLYLRRSDPEIHRSSGSIKRYLWWLPWYVRRLIAYNQVALQLRGLKERARDVGDRRMRYGVKVPGEPAEAVAGSSTGQADAPLSSAATTAAGAALQLEGHDDDDDIPRQSAAMVVDDSDGDVDRRKRAVQPLTLEEYLADMLVEWLKQQQAETDLADMLVEWLKQQRAETETSKDKTSAMQMPCIGIVASDIQNTGTIASEVLPLAYSQLKDRDVIWINLPALHSRRDLPLLAWETLSYILRDCVEKQQQQEEQSSSTTVEVPVVMEEGKLVKEAARFKNNEYSEISKKISKLKIYGSINKIEDRFDEAKKNIFQYVEAQKQTDEAKSKDEEFGRKNKIIEPLVVLVEALRLTQQSTGSSSTSTSSPAGPNSSYSLVEAANLLQKIVDQIEPEIRLDVIQYEDILQELFPASNDEPQQQVPQQEEARTSTALGVEQIKQIIRETAPDIIRELHKFFPPNTNNKEIMQEQEQQEQDGSSVDNKETTTEIAPSSSSSKPDDHVLAAAIQEAKQKLYSIKWKILVQMRIKGIVDKIRVHLKNKKILIIIQDDSDFLHRQWELTRKALNLIGCASGSAVIVTTKYRHRAREFCYPPQQVQPMTCSLVGVYYDRVLRLTGDHQQGKGLLEILHEILDKCDPHEFCMRMFVHALYANPNRSKEDLIKLRDRLVPQQKPLGSNANKVFKFSYNDLHKDYKSCLLYLSIFPQGHKIKRSTLIGRWIVEGLITTAEDWSSTVRHAEQCFDMLITRWLVYPGDISATGEEKCCIVGEVVHGIITNIAKKQHIVNARLSHHLARHFSIFSNLRLRRSDDIGDFVKKLHAYALQLKQLKVLDLDGCQCFHTSPNCLKDICNKIFLLKYLSLRRTNITYLPREINNLHELEILDIRQTKVPSRDTREVVLLKLKRLMAGRAPDPSLSTPSIAATEDDGEQSFSSVRIPYRIQKMESMEVLSNVKASQNGTELKDIGKLCQLRKLGVVITNETNHLTNLLQAVSDLNESLASLSITLLKARSEVTSFNSENYLPNDILKQSPKHLNSLNISGSCGTTKKGLLCLLLTNGWDKLTKLTFSRTFLKQGILKDIGELLPNLLCLRLRHEAYTDEQITFEENMFLKLKYLCIEGDNMARIMFEEKAALHLDKIVLSSTKFLEYLCGTTCLPSLKELDLKGNNDLLHLACFAGAPFLSKVTICRTVLDLSELQILAELPKLRSLMLLEESFNGSSLTFNKGDFTKLNLLVVDCKGITSISFTEKATPKLNKIVWSFTEMKSLSGILYLSELKELELDGDPVPNPVVRDIKAHKSITSVVYRKPQVQTPDKLTAKKRSSFPWFSTINKHQR